VSGFSRTAPHRRLVSRPPPIRVAEKRSQSLDDYRLVSDDAPNGVGRTPSGQRLRRFCASVIAPLIVARL